MTDIGGILNSSLLDEESSKKIKLDEIQKKDEYVKNLINSNNDLKQQLQQISSSNNTLYKEKSFLEGIRDEHSFLQFDVESISFIVGILSLFVIVLIIYFYYAAKHKIIVPNELDIIDISNITPSKRNRLYNSDLLIPPYNNITAVNYKLLDKKEQTAKDKLIDSLMEIKTVEKGIDDNMQFWESLHKPQKPSDDATQAAINTEIMKMQDGDIDPATEYQLNNAARTAFVSKNANRSAKDALKLAMFGGNFGPYEFFAYNRYPEDDNLNSGIQFKEYDRKIQNTFDTNGGKMYN